MQSIEWCVRTIAACLYKHKNKIYYDKSLPHDELALAIACTKAQQYIDSGDISKKDFDDALQVAVTKKKPKTDITNT